MTPINRALAIARQVESHKSKRQSSHFQVLARLVSNQKSRVGARGISEKPTQTCESLNEMSLRLLRSFTRDPVSGRVAPV